MEYGNQMKNVLWAELAAELTSLGETRSFQKTKLKWKNLVKEAKKEWKKVYGSIKPTGGGPAAKISQRAAFIADTIGIDLRGAGTIDGGIGVAKTQVELESESDEENSDPKEPAEKIAKVARPDPIAKIFVSIPKPLAIQKAIPINKCSMEKRSKVAEEMVEPKILLPEPAPTMEEILRLQREIYRAQQVNLKLEKENLEWGKEKMLLEKEKLQLELWLLQKKQHEKMSAELGQHALDDYNYPM